MSPNPPKDQKNAQPASDQQRQNQPTTTGREEHKVDRNAPAGTEDSLGAESIRDGRPSTDDSVVEAIDELDPGEVSPPNRD